MHDIERTLPVKLVAAFAQPPQRNPPHRLNEWRGSTTTCRVRFEIASIIGSLRWTRDICGFRRGAWQRDHSVALFLLDEWAGLAQAALMLCTHDRPPCRTSFACERVSPTVPVRDASLLLLVHAVDEFWRCGNKAIVR